MTDTTPGSRPLDRRAHSLTRALPLAALALLLTVIAPPAAMAYHEVQPTTGPIPLANPNDKGWAFAYIQQGAMVPAWQELALMGFSYKPREVFERLWRTPHEAPGWSYTWSMMEGWRVMSNQHLIAGWMFPTGPVYDYLR